MIKVRESIGAVEGDVATLKTTVGDSSKGLVKKVNGIQTDVTALKGLISNDGTTKMLFGMEVTIDGTTGAVTLTAPASES